MSTEALLLCVAMLVVSEGFFALSEVSLISANRARLRARAAGGSAAAGCALELLAKPERLLATALTGTSLCLVGASFAANEAAARFLGERRSAWAIVVLAPVILVFAEILPKAVARRHADALATAVAYPIRGAMVILTPAVVIASGVSRAIIRLLKKPGDSHPFVTREELRALLRAERRAAFDPEEARMIHRLLGMAGARVREVMTPLPDVVSVPAGAPIGEAIEKIRRHGYSRIPVYQDRTDNIVGVLHSMDLILEPDAEGATTRAMRRPFYVPEAGKVGQLLDEFRKRGHELAIVVDEYGGASGIVTLEDVLEELVGDIIDEFDRPHLEGTDRPGGSAQIAEGSSRLSDLSERLGVAFPRAGYETLAGFIAHRLQRIPKAGDKVEFEGLRLTVVEATERRVRKVRIEPTS